MNAQHTKPVDILLVEDNPNDVELALEAIKDSKLLINMHVVADGPEALHFLHRRQPYDEAPRPDLVLLDLNLPTLSGHAVLQHIKSDEDLGHIPVVVLTTSDSPDDVAQAYERFANAYVTKPIDLDQFIAIVKVIEEFWFSIVKLPPGQA
ncbi:MAG: response regulator [Anaerolineae bacterium]|nr:response regulator [Anaerolineae bacterium]